MRILLISPIPTRPALDSNDWRNLNRLGWRWLQLRRQTTMFASTICALILIL